MYVYAVERATEASVKDVVVTPVARGVLSPPLYTLYIILTPVGDVTPDQDKLTVGVVAVQADAEAPRLCGVGGAVGAIIVAPERDR